MGVPPVRLRLLLLLATAALPRALVVADTDDVSASGRRLTQLAEMPVSPPPLPPPSSPPPSPPVLDHETHFQLKGGAAGVVVPGTLSSDSVPAQSATVSGSPVYGIHGYIDFDGTNDMVAIGQRELGTALSLAVWLRWSQTPTHSTNGRGDFGILEVQSGGVYGPMQVEWYVTDYTEPTGANAKGTLTLRDSSSRANCQSTAMYNADGNWHHYTVTLEPAGAAQTRVKMYADGALKHTCTLSKALLHNMYSTNLGHTIWQGRYTGQMADFRLYPRAISEFELSSISSSPSPPPPPRPEQKYAVCRPMNGSPWKMYEGMDYGVAQAMYLNTRGTYGDAVLVKDEETC